MKVNLISQANMIRTYTDNKSKKEKSADIKKGDSLEISAEARNLHNSSIEGTSGNSAARIEDIKNKIKQGEYNPSPELIAKRMYAMIRGSEV